MIAATNRNLEEEIEKGTFRRDLMYRINTFPITLPPLRNRLEDIPLLVNFFLEKFNRKMGKNISSVDRDCLNSLMKYEWPGNIRELQNVIERAVITCKSNILNPSVGLPSLVNPDCAESVVSGSLASIEKQHISNILEETHWKIEGQNGAAVILEMPPSTLRDRMKKLGISRKSPH